MNWIGRPKSQAGLTLFALLVIIAIIGPLVVIVTINARKKARIAMAVNHIETFKAALNAFQKDNGFYPSTEQGLEALVRKPTTGTIPENYPEGGYLEGGVIPKDSWGNSYIYTSPLPEREADYETIVSLGADGMVGGEDENADLPRLRAIQ